MLKRSKYSSEIEQMKKFCKDNNIRYFFELVDYSARNNQLWYELLCNNTAAFHYMIKYLK